MANAEQNTGFPLTDMPRMGRRNAVAYPSQMLTDDDGAFSPMNLLPRASDSDIDPEGMIALELKLDRRSQEQKSKGAMPAAPLASVLDGWKKLHDAKNRAYNNGIERLFEPTESPKASTSLIETKPTKTSKHDQIENDDTTAGNQRMNPVIPWRKQDIKPTTIAEERRKLFESFDKTSIEPPETPHVSELTLRKLASRRSRQRRNKEYQSHESVQSSFPNKPKDNTKVPFSNVQPKVNTRWDNMDEAQQAPKIKIQTVPDSVDKDAKFKRLATVNEKPSMSNRGKTSNPMKPLQAFPVRKQVSNIENRPKLVTNYPASETVKNTTDKLPLTIAPRYNHKKAMGMMNETRGTKRRADDGLSDGSSNKLFGTIPAHQRPKYEALKTPKAPVGNPLKSTFFNLQRINNGGANVKKKESSTAQLVVSRYSANILGTPVIGLSKKNAPVITTIQAPPSPFLLSKISIQSQMNEIPINGEKIGAGTSKGNKKDAKPIKIQPIKPKIPFTKNNPKGTSEPAKSVQPAVPTLPKVIPTLGAAPNKYNNIYIGPYSGSDSDGEHNSSVKKR